MQGRGSSVSGTNVFHVLLLSVLMFSGFNMMGGQMPYAPTSSSASISTTPVPVRVDFTKVNAASSKESDGRLQMKTFSGTPISPAAPTRTCNSNESVDVMVTLDYSGSMKGDKLAKAKNAAKALATILETNPQNKMGINSFNTSAKLYIQVTDQFPLVKAVIDNLPEGSGATCVKCGIDMASAELAKVPIAPATPEGPQRRRINLLLTDGVANRPKPENGAAQLALQAAQQAYATNQVTFYTIGFGSEELFGPLKGFGGLTVNQALLTQIATQTKGKYYYSPTPDSLKVIFEEIGLIICN